MKLKALSLSGNIPFLILAIFVGAVVYRYAQIPKKRKSPVVYSKYITAFTGGEISSKSPIRVRFINEMVNSSEINKEVYADLFDFEPYIGGNTKWIDTRTIEFTPYSALDHNKAFKATLFLKQIIPTIADSLSKFQFQFRTKKQAMKVDISMPSPIDNEKPQWQKIEGVVTLMDAEPMEKISELFAAYHGDQPVNITWKELTENNYRFAIDSILRTNTPSEIEIKWSNNYYSSFECNGTKKISIPPLGNFSHIHTISCSYPAQSITLEFSDPIKKNQVLDGLIRIGNTDATFTIEDNKIHVFPTKRLLGEKEITIEQNIQNTQGHVLQSKSSATVLFDELYPEIKQVGKGTIIPHSTILPFAFEAVNISAVDVRIIQITEKNIPQFLQINKLDEHNELKRVGKIILNKKIVLGKNKKIDLKNWNRHVIDLSKLIQTEPGAIYQVAIGFRKSYSLYPCDDTSSTDSSNMLDIDPDSWGDPDQYYYENDYSYYEDEEYDDWQDPCKKRYYNSNKMIVRNILASNLGIITKRGSEGTVFTAVTDLLSTTPLAGVTIEIYDYQQYLIASGKTGQDGTINIKLKGKPFLLIAKYGKQRGYLHMDNGSSLSLSRFDTGGKEYHKGMKGFIFGERDVWRPGDSIYLNFILEDKLKSLPTAHPVVFELYNPQQELIRRIVKTTSVHNFYAFHTATDADARTGTYSVKVIAGGATFEKNIKIETIIANRLKIDLNWEQIEDEKKDQQLKGKLSAHWLHGAIAQNLKAEASVTFTEAKATFKNYENYVFDDPSKKFIAETKEIFKGNLSTTGVADITADLHIEGEVPSMLKANVKARVYEPGGNFSTSYFSIPFHTYETYVGIENGAGSSKNMLSTNKEHAIKLVTLDAKGKPVSGKKITVELYKISWKWWWDATEDDEFSYNGRSFAQCIQKDSLTTINGKAQWMLRVRPADWGRYLIKVWDADGHCSGKIVYMDWPGWGGRGEEENPQGTKMLVFSANKEVYAAGENITLNIPTGFAGRALLSLESGTKVIGSYWIQAQKGMTQFTFPATKNMAPNVYAHITLIQPHAQTSNDLPMRMYGILPLRVEDPATHLHPVITMADQLKPEQKASISIGERDGKPMTYTIAIVDEGLLDLTRYRIPDVWSNFNERQALDVKTWDMFDEVAGADASKIKNLLSIGGDGSRGPLEGAKANRFKPVVLFMGPYHTGAGESSMHTFTLPNYVGSVRVMVIAAENGTYGTEEKTVAVKKPLMLLGTLPRVLGPNESFKFPVTVFAMESRIKNVSIQLEVNGLLTSTGSTMQQISFSETGEKLISFPLNVKGMIGKATVRVTARSGKETAIYETEIEVRNPNPRIYNVSETTLDANKLWIQSNMPAGMTGSNRATIEVSSIPPLNLTKRLGYLIHYPYGCVEQTTSSVFPQLFLNKLLSLSAQQKNEADKNIKAGIARLKTFQLNDGSLSYWQGDHETNDWGTCYAGHFMIEAERIGYILPYGFKDKWINYEKTTARNWNDDDEISQAYRLYLLALAKAPEIGAMNRMRLTKIKSTPAIWYLAAAYHLAGQPDLAKEMTATAALTVNDYKELSNTFGSDERDKAIVLQSLSIIGQKTKAAPLMRELAATLNSNESLNTQSTAYALVAIATYTGATRTTSNMLFSYRTKEGVWKEVNTTSPIWQYSWDNNEASTVEIKNTGQGVLFTKVITTGIPIEGDKTDASNGLRLSIDYISMDGRRLNPASVTQGTDFMALVTVVNTGTRNYQHMSLTQIFPSGWEIHNTRMDPSGKTYNYDAPDYEDIRDDRINSFYDLAVKQKKTFMVLLHASYEGHFYLPTVYSEAMYDHAINARQHGMWVEVTPNAVHL
jgi:uncharacterized protein YfaS (alpha-2-macroglobulin family)